MFLRAKIRHKDGKAHRAWSVVENRRVHDGRVVQRQVLYLGEINDSQKAAWSKAIEVFDEGADTGLSMMTVAKLAAAANLTPRHVWSSLARLERLDYLTRARATHNSSAA